MRHVETLTMSVLRVGCKWRQIWKVEIIIVVNVVVNLIGREYGKDMWLVDAEKLYDDLANDLKWIMGDGSNGEDLDTYAHVGNTIRETFNDQEWYQGGFR